MHSPYAAGPFVYAWKLHACYRLPSPEIQRGHGLCALRCCHTHAAALLSAQFASPECRLVRRTAPTGLGPPFHCWIPLQMCSTSPQLPRYQSATLRMRRTAAVCHVPVSKVFAAGVLTDGSKGCDDAWCIRSWKEFGQHLSSGEWSPGGAASGWACELLHTQLCACGRHPAPLRDAALLCPRQSSVLCQRPFLHKKFSSDSTV